MKLRTFRSYTATKEDITTELELPSDIMDGGNEHFDFSWIGEIEGAEGLHFNIMARSDAGDLVIDKIKSFEEIIVNNPRRIFG